eukprot:1004643-Prymnesium_polylepis.1
MGSVRGGVKRRCEEQKCPGAAAQCGRGRAPPRGRRRTTSSRRARPLGGASMGAHRWAPPIRACA